MKKEKFHKYRLVDYYDVWGNAKDGYEVNDIAVVEDEIVMSENITDEEIIDYLISIEYLNRNLKGNIKIEGNDYFIELFRESDMYPLYRLERTDI